MDRARTLVAGFLQRKTKSEILVAAISRKLLCVPIYDTADVAHSPQLESGTFSSLWARARESARCPDGSRAPPCTEPCVTGPAPLPGEQHDEVLADWLGATPPASNPPPGASCARATRAR